MILDLSHWLHEGEPEPVAVHLGGENYMLVKIAKNGDHVTLVFEHAGPAPSCGP
jgi:hypothetical protein